MSRIVLAALCALLSGCGAGLGEPMPEDVGRDCRLVHGGLEACERDPELGRTLYCRDLVERCGDA